VSRRAPIHTSRDLCQIQILFLKPLLFARGQLFGAMCKIAIFAKLTLTIRRIVSTKNSLDDISFPLEHILGGHAHPWWHTGNTHSGHASWLFGTKLGGAVRVVAVIAVATVTLLEDVFTHGCFVVAAGGSVASHHHL